MFVRVNVRALTVLPFPWYLLVEREFLFLFSGDGEFAEPHKFAGAVAWT